MQQNGKEKTVLELKTGLNKMEIENARKDKRMIDLTITAAWQERSRVQREIEDFALTVKTQVVNLRDASTAGEDYILSLLLLEDACDAAVDLAKKIEAAGSSEQISGYLYDGSALLAGTVLECYYNPEKDWGTVYVVDSDALPNGRQELVVSTKYPVPSRDTVAVFASQKTLHKPYTIAELTNRFQQKAEGTAAPNTGAAIEIGAEEFFQDGEKSEGSADSQAEVEAASSPEEKH